MINYFARHIQVLLATIGDMVRSPIATINTTLIIAVTILLPMLLFIVVKSAEKISGTWEGRPQISVFLQHDVSDNEAQLIYQEIQLHPTVALAEFVSAEQALEEFRLLADSATLEQELDFIGGNPLPPSIVLMPTDDASNQAQLDQLQDQLLKIEGIESIRLDLEWTQRFSAIVHVIVRVGTLLSSLLAVALILIVGNTIKLLIHNRRDEIEITKLVGGTDTFVRRPFLYYGALFGFMGASIALIFAFVAGVLIAEPISHLSSLYQSQTLLYRLNLTEVVVILSVGTLLGWISARWSVAQHLWKIRPR